MLVRFKPLSRRDYHHIQPRAISQLPPSSGDSAVQRIQERQKAKHLPNRGACLTPAPDRMPYFLRKWVQGWWRSL